MGNRFTIARVHLLALPVLAILFSVLTATPALAASPVPACGHANIDNPGHHYGLIKNGCLSTSSVPPLPLPIPTPRPNPVSTQSPGQPLPAPVTAPGPAKPAAGIPNNHSVPAVAPAIVAAPEPTSRPQLIGSTAPAPEQSFDFILWLTMALLVAMVAIWLFLIGRATAHVVRNRRVGPAAITARA